MKKKVLWPKGLLFIISVSAAYISHSQLKGDHLLGDFGLNAGTQAPPSVIAAIPFYWYDASKLRNSDGDIINNNPDLSMSLIGVGASVVSNFKILNANYGASILAAFASNRIEGNKIQLKNSLAFADMYIQPLQLGWHTKRADIIASYGLYLPTGAYEYGASDNSGLGMWTHEAGGAVTLFLDSKKTFNFSTAMFYELHSKKKDTTAKVGDIISLEGGIGKTFYKPITGSKLPLTFNAGIIYYMQFKVTDDKIPIGGSIFTGSKDQIYGLGLEFNILYPKSFTSLSIRWISELGAKNRFEGNTLFITFAQFLKSFAKSK